MFAPFFFVAACAVLLWRRWSIVRSTETLWRDFARGFLPRRTPSSVAYVLPEAELRDLPRLICTNAVQERCDRLPTVHLGGLLRSLSSRDAECLAERAHLVYSFLSYAYLREQTGACRHLCTALAVPWRECCTYLGRHMNLDYASTVLTNCDVARDVVHATFTGDDEERAFYMLHAKVEQAIAPFVRALVHCVDDGSRDAVRCALQQMVESYDAATGVLGELENVCSAAFFNTRLRHHLDGFTDLTVLTSNRRPRPTQFVGATGAQSCILLCADAFLGFVRSRHLNSQHLTRAHADLMRKLVTNPPASKSKVGHDPALTTVRCKCVQSVRRFRVAHLNMVRRYIPTRTRGTGGSDVNRHLAAQLGNMQNDS